MSDLRRYLTIASAFLGVLLLVTVAFAAADLDVAEEHRNANATKAAEEGETEDADKPEEAKVPEGEGGEDNHGQCVSAAAQHEADGLEGWRKGLFVSSVAQDESMVGADCDFSSHLSAALSAESKGGGGTETAEANAPEDAGDEGEAGKEAGEAKRAEHQPEDTGDDAEED
ncbi:MAG: hypothetical protein ACRD1T_05320 [Acidimicrobiia bacterium]